MIIHGKERSFLMTVQASVDIAEMCPDGDLSRVREALDGSQMKALRFIAKFIAALSRGYENNRKYEEPGYDPDPLTVDEILSMPFSEIKAVETEALKAFYGSAKTEIDTKDQPKKEEGTAEA